MIQRIRYNKWKEIIKESGLFDSKYYLFTYPDVREKDVDPIVHYIKYGVQEGRNPSLEFDTKFYFRMYPDIIENKINPLVHFILHGKKRKCINNLVTGS